MLILDSTPHLPSVVERRLDDLRAVRITSATVTCEHWSTPERLIALTTPRRRVPPIPDDL
jgi:hypothetical protein